MKALTLTQPWAQLVALNAKQIETRSWSTQYRGTLAIHAARGFPKEAKDLIYSNPFCGHLVYFKEFPRLPLGAIVAVCELTAVHRFPQTPQHFQRFDRYFIHTDKSAEYRNHPQASYPITLPPWSADIEFPLGDFTAGRFGWILTDIKPLQTPIPCKGALSLWDVPAEVEALVSEQLK